MNETTGRYGQGVGTGLAVGNLYWAQPLLAAIAADFEVPASQGSFLITATQIGYASGILLLVPLGDIVERKRLLTAVMGRKPSVTGNAAQAGGWLLPSRISWSWPCSPGTKVILTGA